MLTYQESEAIQFASVYNLFKEETRVFLMDSQIISEGFFEGLGSIILEAGDEERASSAAKDYVEKAEKELEELRKSGNEAVAKEKTKALIYLGINILALLLQLTPIGIVTRIVGLVVQLISFFLQLSANLKMDKEAKKSAAEAEEMKKRVEVLIAKAKDGEVADRLKKVSQKLDDHIQKVKKYKS
jgi:hypothetical protein